MFLLLINLFLQIDACVPVPTISSDWTENVDKITMLSSHIKSFPNDFWGNVKLPEKWIHWKSILDKTKDEKFE
ncbi:MAG TPA: hypothetical protein VKR58_11155, partial [Aquella sp.]|nr:hypothetical protein [Aquella sp.]